MRRVFALGALAAWVDKTSWDTEITLTNDQATKIFRCCFETTGGKTKRLTPEELRRGRVRRLSECELVNATEVEVPS